MFQSLLNYIVHPNEAMDSLEEYRSKASFDVKLMFDEMEPRANIEIKVRASGVG